MATVAREHDDLRSSDSASYGSDSAALGNVRTFGPRIEVVQGVVFDRKSAGVSLVELNQSRADGRDLDRNPMPIQDQSGLG